MMEETVAFLEYLLGLIFGILVGIVFGGLWAVVGPAVFRDPLDGPSGYYGIEWKLAHQAIDPSLDAEAQFAAACPGQDYAIHWWGWSPGTGPDRLIPLTASPSQPGNPLASFGQSFSNLKITFMTRLGPWLRLVCIRCIVVMSILVAAVLPTFALWLDGRRRAYALLATGRMPSTRLWKIWAGITTMLALLSGFLIGAPIPIGMAPWLLLVVLTALLSLCQVRAHKNARLS